MMTLLGLFEGITLWMLFAIGGEMWIGMFTIRNTLANILDQGWQDETERAKHRDELPWQLGEPVDDK
jgi:hypothetical protein